MPAGVLVVAPPEDELLDELDELDEDVRLGLAEEFPPPPPPHAANAKSVRAPNKAFDVVVSRTVFMILPYVVGICSASLLSTKCPRNG